MHDRPLLASWGTKINETQPLPSKNLQFTILWPVSCSSCELANWVHWLQYFKVSISFFSFFSFGHHVACGILVPRPEIEPRSSAVKTQSPNHWLPGNSLFFLSFISVFRGCSGSLRHGFQALVLHICDTIALSPCSFPWTCTFSRRTLERWFFSAWNKHIWVKTSSKEPSLK